MIRLALDREKRIHGYAADHPDISRTLTNLGIIAQENGDNDGALNFYWRSLEMDKRLQDYLVLTIIIRPFKGLCAELESSHRKNRPR